MVVDSSAIVAILFDEPAGEELGGALAAEPCVMSAATQVELGIVVEARSGPAGSQLLEELLARLQVEVVPVDETLARAAPLLGGGLARAPPAGLNFGDTFSYALATQLDQPLAFVGQDFVLTDVASVLRHT
ncbi:MAG: type II toxin-antitoxin system VapC family toxin [Acidimicrobiia bacterium]|nr:type II toxin-antitoxin system VapC family toxin [Acidimicrobiia bacterium]